MARVPMTPRKILFLSSALPAAGRSGGRQAVYNHLLALAASPEALEVDLLAVDVDESGESLPGELAGFQATTLRRDFPGWRSPGGKWAAIAQLLFDPRPRAAAMVAGREPRRQLARRLATKRYDAIVVDHANAWALLQGQEGLDGPEGQVPVTYIAHNVEADILRDELAQAGWLSPHRVRLVLEWLKTRRYEQRLLARASRIVCISSFDRDTLARRGVRGTLLTWPELPMPRPPVARRWDGQRLLFVGSAGHFPNVEAVRWLATELMPQLAALCPGAVLHVAGCSRQDVPQAQVPACVVLEGFVSAERLDELHRLADLFVCPVVLGSGVKIKVLEAAAYGLPVAATPESLRGIDFLKDLALVIGRDPGQAARAIAQALVSPSRLEELSTQGLAALASERERRPPLATIL